MANTEILTKIILRNDVLSAWQASTIILEKGEMALELDAATKVAKIKVGNGSSTWAQLPYSTMTPDEIAALISQKITDEALNTISISTGSNNGTIKLTVDGTVYDNIAVKGLGSAAYTNSNAYATAAQGTKADNAMPKSGGTFTGPVTLAADPTTALGAATKQFVESTVSNAISTADAMIFKGTLGTGGTVTTLPTDAKVGNTYKVISEISVPEASSVTGAAVSAKVGDLVVRMESGKWLVVPSGDEAVTTVSISTSSVNVDTTKRTGEVRLGAAAAKQVDTTIGAASTSENLPTSKAVAAFVEGKKYVTTDEKVKNTPASSTKIYLTGTDTAAESTGTQKFNTGVYVDTDNKMVAPGFKGDLTGTADKAKSLTAGIKASLTGGAVGTAATAANAGGTIEVAVTQINTDYLVNGAKTLVLNGGSATA